VIEHDDVQSRALEDLSNAVNYRRWLAGLAAPYLGDDPIEIGAGIGDYAIEWLRTLPRLTVTEADDSRLKILHERFVDDPRVTVRRLMLPSTERREHSAAIALNVLEHIEEDVAAVRSAARLLRPDGAMVLVVPAFPSAMSRFDRTVGHFRRYTANSLSTVLVSAGLAIEELHYLNPIGLINWYLVCTLLGTFPRNGTLLREYDRLIVPAAKWLERRWHPPFGQSLFAVARPQNP
jgi:SAM-dependent methyltransferase